MRISDWSSDVCSSDLHRGLVGRLPPRLRAFALLARFDRPIGWWLLFWPGAWGVALAGGAFSRWELLLWLLLGAIAMRGAGRSEEHTSELQSLMRISYAVFCLKKKKITTRKTTDRSHPL